MFGHGTRGMCIVQCAFLMILWPVTEYLTNDEAWYDRALSLNYYHMEWEWEWDYR